MKFHIPRPIAMVLTGFQLSQMVVGLVVNFHAYATKLNGDACDISYHHLNMGLVMYASYFLLFAKFFFQAYYGRKSAKANAAAALLENNNNNLAERVTTRSRANKKMD